METPSSQLELNGPENCQSGDTNQIILNNTSSTISNSMIGNVNVHGDVTIVSPTADSHSRSRTTSIKISVNNFRQPSNDFVECKTFTDVKEKLTKSESLVLHLHGFPGTGKSAIVRKLAADFPFNKNEEKISVKYLIECSDSSEDIGESLKNLVKQMWEYNLIFNEVSCNRACEQLMKKQTVGFVELLVEAAIPVLIVIEDPPDEQLEILNDLLSSFLEKISSQATKSLSNAMYLCITSRSKDVCKLSNFYYFKKYQVDGLTEEEGLKLLDIACENSETEREAALKIISDLHGSPLGLIAVRATCRKSRLCYEEYGHLRDVSHLKEIEHLKEELGPHIKHLYQAMVTLLDEKGLWDTMKVLSFFHHGAIPQRLIGMVKLRQQTTNDHQSYVTHLKIKQESGVFISRLTNFAICEVKGDSYEETQITLHQLVFLSVQAYVIDKLPAFHEAIFSLAFLVQKDIRVQTKYNFVRSMIPHMLSVIRFVDLHPDVCNDFVTSMVVVHLREVYGNTAKHFDSVAAERSLMECARTIWKEISKRSGIKQDFDDYLNRKKIPAIEIAQTIFEACLAAGDQLQEEEDLLDTYICVMTQFKPGGHDAHSNDSANQEMVERLKLLSNYSLPLTPDELRSFRRLEDGKLFLDIKTHCQVFFIDRLVSVLYSLSRVVLYDSCTTEKKKDRCVWICDIVHALCEQCRQRTSVHLSYLRKAAVNRVNVRLKNFGAVKAIAKKGILTDEMMVVKSNLEKASNQVSVVFYGNYLRTTTEENAFDELFNLRSMIRIHTKLLPLCPDEEEAKDIKQSADQFYERLCVKARANIERWILSPKCLVYCGKYMALLGNYSKAIDHFQEALSCKAIVEEKADLFPWVCYNYARATVIGKLLSRKDYAFEKCNEALQYQGGIPDDLTTKLKKQIERLAGLEH